MPELAKSCSSSQFLVAASRKLGDNHCDSQLAEVNSMIALRDYVKIRYPHIHLLTREQLLARQATLIRRSADWSDEEAIQYEGICRILRSIAYQEQKKRYIPTLDQL